MNAKEVESSWATIEAFHSQGLELPPQAPGLIESCGERISALPHDPVLERGFLGSVLGTYTIAPKGRDSVALSGSASWCFTFQPHWLIHC